MATAAADSSTNITTNAHSPKFRWGACPGSSPWSHVVRSEAEATAAPSSPSPSPPFPSAAAVAHAPDLEPSVIPVATPGPSSPAGESDAAVGFSDQQGSAANAAAATKGEKKSPWNRPSKGSIEVGPVICAVSWPPLSESTRASPKSSSSDSLKYLSDGSVPAPPEQVMPNPLINSVPSNTNPVSSSNNPGPMRQKSFKRGGGSSSSSSSNSSNGGAATSGLSANDGPVPPSPRGWPEAPQVHSDKPVAPELLPRELPNKNGGNYEHGPRAGGFSSKAHGRNEHQRGYGGSHRRGNNGGGSHHNSFNSRHGQDRGSNGWNSHPNFNGREVQTPLQHQQMPVQRPFLRAPLPGPAPFINPPSPVRHFGAPIGFPEVPPPIFYVPTPPPPPDLIRAMPYVASPVFIAPDPQLPNLLLNQIEYYFSPQNLCKDLFLRKNMNDEGWVPIALIANFNRVKQLTNNIQFILDTMQSSSVVEVQGDKIRKRQDWRTWLITPSANQFANNPPSLDTLVSHMGNMGIVDEAAVQNSAPAQAIDQPSSGTLHSQNSNGDGTESLSAS